MSPEYVPVEELKAADDPRWRALVAGVWTSDESPAQFRARVARRDRAARRRPRGRPHRGRVPRWGDQHLPRRRARPRSDASRLLLPELHVDPSRDGGRHRTAFDPDDQRDIAPARHRAAHRAAPDWLTMPGPHSLADLVSHLDASPSPFHAVESARERLEAAGFGAVSERDAWDGVPARGCHRPRRRADRLGPARRRPSRRRVPLGRRPHRLARPPCQAQPRHRCGGLASARRRGLRRCAPQLVARPRPRHRRPGRDRTTARRTSSTCTVRWRGFRNSRSTSTAA